MLPVEVIRAKRDGRGLTDAQIDAFVRGLVDGSWGEGQVAALAMAILIKGMNAPECAALTRAMTHSGEVLDWRDANFAGPILDKHSTGGVGDKVSLMLAPIVAACGGVVPMISGRGLGHTGGTLDKLEALPGYGITPSRDRLLAVLHTAGCAIVGASAQVAPADRRLYAVRDVTATVESVPLITASILSKKLAAGLQDLVMDVKVGNGAFSATLDEARTLAASLVDVACAAGLPTEALITDMSQVLGFSAGNALEVREAIDFLSGAAREPRLLDVTLQLAGRLLRIGGLAASIEDGMTAARQALDSGHAAERFARMVAGLGGPADVFADAELPDAPVRRVLEAPRDGFIAAMDTRAIGLAVLSLGAGRRQAGDPVDPRVGIDGVRAVGASVRRGEPLLVVHAASDADAETAVRALMLAIRIDESPPAVTPVIHASIVAAR